MWLVPSVLWHCWLTCQTEWYGSGIIVCLEQGDLHMPWLMPLTPSISLIHSFIRGRGWPLAVFRRAFQPTASAEAIDTLYLTHSLIHSSGAAVGRWQSFDVPFSLPPALRPLSPSISCFIKINNVLLFLPSCASKYVIGPILWGHSGPLCHALSSSSLLSWTSMRRQRATVAACNSSDTWWITMWRRLAVANGPNIFQMLLVLKVIQLCLINKIKVRYTVMHYIWLQWLIHIL